MLMKTWKKYGLFIGTLEASIHSWRASQGSGKKRKLGRSALSKRTTVSKRTSAISKGTTALSKANIGNSGHQPRLQRCASVIREGDRPTNNSYRIGRQLHYQSR